MSQNAALKKNSILPLLIVGFLFLARGGGLAQEQQRQATPPEIVKRPFPTTQVAIGDVVLAIPTKWLDRKFIEISRGKQRYVGFANANLAQFRPTEHFQVPSLALFDLVEVPPGLSDSNLQMQRAEHEKRWSERTADDAGFWHWKTTEFVFVTDALQRPLGQPLIVRCRDAVPQSLEISDTCSVWFYWTPLVSVRYEFRKMQFPESEWTRLDGQVLDLLQFLDGSQAIASNR
jgi:hypothetical protein